MTIHNINEYKKAQIFVKDLEKILKILNAAEASLKNYEKYRPVQTVLTAIYEEKPIVEIFLEQNKITVMTKGEKRR
jgi:D-alanyl-D-alanine dipeptidase